MDWALYITAAVTAIATIILLYKHYSKHFCYWQSQGIPAAKAIIIFGIDVSNFFKPVYKLDLNNFKKYGRIFGTYSGGTKILNIAEPEIAKMILIKDFGYFVNRFTARSGISLLDSGIVLALDDDWKRIRSITSPNFSTGKLKNMSMIFKDVAKELIQDLLQCAEKGETVSMKKKFSQYSIEVMGACAFGIRFDSFKERQNPFTAVLKKSTTDGMVAYLIFAILFLIPKRMTSLRRYLERIIGYTAFAEAVIEIMRQKQNEAAQKHIDFLTLLMESKEEKSDDSKKENQGASEMNNDKNPNSQQPWKKTLNEEELIAQSASLLRTGYSAQVTALSYIAYNLVRHPEVQERLRQEIDDAWDKHGELDYDAINNMPYLDAVISETFRLQTISPRLVRVCNTDYKIPNTNIIVPKGTLVHILLYALHHNPEFFPEPDKFKPERFLPENKHNIIPYSFIPYGDGPRNCVAIRFAILEIKFCFAYLLRYVKLVSTADTQEPLNFNFGGLTTKSRKLINVQVEKRRNFQTS